MNSVFHPPGSNPFQLPPLPQSHYLPSPSKEIQDKSVTLTPQKLHRRHEYSLPPEVYTPEQYSIIEDNSPGSGKPPLPTADRDDVVCDLQRYLNDVESWTSSKFAEKWPSKESRINEDLSLDLASHTAAMPSRSSSGPLTSTARSIKPVKLSGTKPLRLKTSFASDRNLSADSERSSNIAEKLNRFRYGDPKPREIRKRERMILPSQSMSYTKTRTEKSPVQYSRPQSTSMRLGDLSASQSQKKSSADFKKSSSRSTSKFDSKPPEDPKLSDDEAKILAVTPSKRDSADFMNASLSTLNSRLEKLLQESSSVISSPSPRSSLQTSTDKSSSFDAKVSSIDTTVTDDLRVKNGGKLYDMSLPRKMQWQKENIPAHKVRFSPSKHQDNDILYQWRLKRKLENARDDVAKNKGPPFRTPNPHQSLHRNEAERPLSVEASPDICGSYGSPQQIPVQRQFQHYQGCNCHMGQCSRNVVNKPHVTDQNYGPGFLPPLVQNTPEMKSVGVHVAPMISTETQTSKSLIFSDDEVVQRKTTGEIVPDMVKRSSSMSSFPHTSTPASSVSFHRVKIVQAELENSPQTSKGSPQARVASPLSCRTEATTTWSSTDHHAIAPPRSESIKKEDKESEGSRSPVSSVKTSEPRFASDSQTCSPTANVVRQVVGSRLFNTTQTPHSTSKIQRLKEKKKQTKQIEQPTPEELNGSYTSKSQESEGSSKDAGSVSVLSRSEKEAKEVGKKAVPSLQSSEDTVSNYSEELSFTKSQQHQEESDKTVEQVDEEITFDPGEMFDKLLEDIANDPGDYPDDPVLTTLRKQRDKFLEEFRAIEEEIEKLPDKD